MKAVEIVNFLGVFQIFRGGSRLLDTWGFHGALSVLFSILYFKKYPRESLLTLTPCFLYVFPPAVLLMSLYFPEDAPYRMIYLIPTSLMLVLGLKETLSKIPLSSAMTYLLVVITVVGLSAPVKFPWRGRLFFSFYRVPDELSLRYLDTLPLSKFKITPDCALLGEDMSMFALTYLRDRIRYPLSKKGSDFRIYSRLVPKHWLNKWSKRQSKGYSFRTVFSNLHNLCGVLVPNFDTFPKPRSTIGRISGHWDPASTDPRSSLEHWVNFDVPILLDMGWRRVQISPTYYLYKPPLNPNWVTEYQYEGSYLRLKPSELSP